MQKNDFLNLKINFEKKKITKIFIVFLFWTLQSLILNLQSVSAQTLPHQSLRVTPIINDLKLIPGKQISFPLTVENISQNSVGIHAELSGFDVTGETPITEQQPSAMVNWTALSPEDSILGPGEKKAIIVTITPPKNTGRSGYYETIFLTPILHQQQVASSPVILSRIAVLVLGTIGNLNYDELAKKVTITHIDPSHTILDKTPQTISFSVANSYFTHFDAKPFLTITPLFGNPQTILLADKHVLPGNSRTWKYQPSLRTPSIFYQLHLAVSIGNGKQIMADTWFVVFPYKVDLVLIISIVLLFILITKRKRLKKFVSILIHG
jgi:hypothetical protein